MFNWFAQDHQKSANGAAKPPPDSNADIPRTQTVEEGWKSANAGHLTKSRDASAGGKKRKSRSSSGKKKSEADEIATSAAAAKSRKSSNGGGRKTATQNGGGKNPKSSFDNSNSEELVLWNSLGVLLLNFRSTTVLLSRLQAHFTRRATAPLGRFSHWEARIIGYDSRTMGLVTIILNP